MGIQPTNIPQIDFRNPSTGMSQPGTSKNSSNSEARNAKNKKKFGQGKNPNGIDYNQFLDPNNAQNWRGTGQPGTRGSWFGAPGAQGYGFNPDQFAGNGRWALGGQGSYGNSVQMDRNSNYPDTTSRIKNSNNNNLNKPYKPSSVKKINPLYSMPQLNKDMLWDASQNRPNTQDPNLLDENGYTAYQNSLNKPYFK